MSVRVSVQTNLSIIIFLKLDAVWFWLCKTLMELTLYRVKKHALTHARVYAKWYSRQLMHGGYVSHTHFSGGWSVFFSNGTQVSKKTEKVSVHIDTSHIVRNHQSQPFSISFYRLFFVTHFNWNFPINRIRSCSCVVYYLSIKIHTQVCGGEENKWKFLYERMMCLGVIGISYVTATLHDKNTRHGTYNEL